MSVAEFSDSRLRSHSTGSYGTSCLCALDGIQMLRSGPLGKVISYLLKSESINLQVKQTSGKSIIFSYTNTVMIQYYQINFKSEHTYMY